MNLYTVYSAKNNKQPNKKNDALEEMATCASITRITHVYVWCAIKRVDNKGRKEKNAFKLLVIFHLVRFDG